jgi:hypothetical protein
MMNNIRGNKNPKTIAFFVFISFFIFFISTNSFGEDNLRIIPSGYLSDKTIPEKDLPLQDAAGFALLFSGVEEDKIDDQVSIIVSLVDEFKQQIPEGSSGKAIAENALVFLHKKILKQYSEDQTLIDVLLSSGKYNCVSSAVLYLLLVKSAGIPVSGVKTTDHAFCRVNADGKDYDVETTNEYGFDPGSKKDFSDSFGNVTGYSYVSPANYRKRKDISEQSLIALILNNRISYLTSREHYPETVGLAVDAYAFSKDQESYDNMIGSFMNMGALYNKKMLYSDGILFFDSVTEMYGPIPKIDEAVRGLANNNVVRLINEKKYGEARSFIAARSETGKLDKKDYTDFSIYVLLAESDDVSKKSFKDAMALVLSGIAQYGADKRLVEIKNGLANNWIISLVESKKIDDAVSVIEDLFSKSVLDRNDYKKYSVYAYQEKSRNIAKEKGNIAAARFLKDILKKIGDDKVLGDYYDYLISDFEVDVHNKVAKLFNSGKYEDAKKVLEDALSELPSSEKIAKDLEMVKSKLRQ